MLIPFRRIKCFVFYVSWLSYCCWQTYLRSKEWQLGGVRLLLLRLLRRTVNTWWWAFFDYCVKTLFLLWGFMLSKGNFFIILERVFIKRLLFFAFLLLLSMLLNLLSYTTAYIEAFFLQFWFRMMINSGGNAPFLVRNIQYIDFAEICLHLFWISIMSYKILRWHRLWHDVVDVRN